ncbi:hypothetical protein FQN57_000139 [Myotisia sp. PD_48]|nr:hypothetical protein FQN57_000139 [Myotisia sp. PD_48]
MKLTSYLCLFASVVYVTAAPAAVPAGGEDDLVARGKSREFCAKKCADDIKEMKAECAGMKPGFMATMCEKIAEEGSTKKGQEQCIYYCQRY